MKPLTIHPQKHSCPKWKRWFAFLISLFFALLSDEISAAHAVDIVPELKADNRSLDDLLRQIETFDPAFYRIEKDFQRSTNDPMRFAYNGLSHYSSTVSSNVLNFLAKLGYKQTYYWTRYGQGSTVFSESLLGVKYLLSDHETLSKPYRPCFTEEGVTVFENPYAFPIGFSAENDLVLETGLYSTDLFQIQNNLFQTFAGERTDRLLNEANGITRRLENLQPFTEENESGYRKINPATDGFLTWEIQIERSDPLYFLIDTPYRGNTAVAEVFINDGSGESYLSQDRYGILPLGRFAPSETVTIRLKLLQPQLALGEPTFVYEDLAALSVLSQKMQAKAVALQKISSSHLAGTVTVPAEDSYLFFSIPFDEGWTIRIDGIETASIPVFGALTAVPVTPGTHSVDLRYRPPGFLIGAGISAAAVILLAAWLILRKRRGAGNP